MRQKKKNAVSLVLCSLKQKQKPTGRSHLVLATFPVKHFQLLLWSWWVGVPWFPGIWENWPLWSNHSSLYKRTLSYQSRQHILLWSMVMRMDQMCDDVLFGLTSLLYSTHRGIPTAKNIPPGMFSEFGQWS